KISSTPLFDPALWHKSLNVDSLIRAQNFTTLALIDSLQRQTDPAFAEWDSTLASFQQEKERLEALKTELLAIRPAQLKTVEEITSALTVVDDTRKTVGQLSSSFNTRYSAISDKVKTLTASVSTIDEAVAGDVKQVLSQARLPDIDAMGLAEQFVGRKILTDLQKAARWIDAGRSLARRYTPKPDYEKPPRLQGQDIHFPAERGYPKLWIKEIIISGGTDRAQNSEYIYLSGMVKNISSDQGAAGEPLTIDLSGNRGDGISLSFSGLMDRRSETPVDEYRANLSGFRLDSFSLGKTDFLPTTVADTRLAADVSAAVAGQTVDIRGDLHLRSMKLNFAVEPRNIGERIARDVLSDVSGLDAGFRVWRKEGGLDASFTTDLDDQFAAGIKRVVGAELAALQNQIRKRVEDEIAGKRRTFERAFSAEKTKVQGRLEEYKALIEENKRMIEEKKKELEARLEEIKKGAVDRVLKDVFKRN
ncbi:hypothetical protein JXO59_14320, partial [candidate division KSB1 bacterium]|nr:hypothetical protein [candidate division KSB1 bacterium]